MERIKKLLVSHDIRPSHHRIKVLEYLANQKIHPTVDQIHQELAHFMPTISKATIYNTLKILVEKGLVRSFNISGDETLYEYKRRNHAHFHCLECGKVRDVEEDCSCFEVDQVGPHQVSEVQLFFKGICGKCLKQKGESF